MKWLSRMERWFFQRILRKVLWESTQHEDRLKELYKAIFDASRDRFYEETVPGLYAFLDECYFDTPRRKYGFFNPEHAELYPTSMNGNDAANTNKQVEPPVAPSLLITRGDILGEIAGWAVRQSPYVAPDNLDEALEGLSAELDSMWTVTHQNFRAAYFSNQYDLCQTLVAAFQRVPQIVDWGKPKSAKDDTVMVFVSRYEKPHPDDDSIDLDALARNVAKDLWSDAVEFHDSCVSKPNAPQPTTAH